MVKREEFNNGLYNIFSQASTEEIVYNLIDEIFDAIGTCRECKYYDNCIILKIGHRYEKVDTFYCADFEKRTDAS